MSFRETFYKADISIKWTLFFGTNGVRFMEIPLYIKMSSEKLVIIQQLLSNYVRNDVYPKFDLVQLPFCDCFVCLSFFDIIRNFFDHHIVPPLWCDVVTKHAYRWSVSLAKKWVKVWEGNALGSLLNLFSYLLTIFSCQAKDLFDISNFLLRTLTKSKKMKDIYNRDVF